MDPCLWIWTLTLLLFDIHSSSTTMNSVKMVSEMKIPFSVSDRCSSSSLRLLFSISFKMMIVMIFKS